jgi:hypothetical protein
MSRLKEIAKFACGAEAFHAFVHAYFWFSNTTLIVFGITQTPTLNLVSAIVNAVISVALGVYAWGLYGRQSA